MIIARRYKFNTIQGSVGVEGVLNILKDELKITMQLAGMPYYDKIIHNQLP